jgi:hypothetical protein
MGLGISLGKLDPLRRDDQEKMSFRYSYHGSFTQSGDPGID